VSRHRAAIAATLLQSCCRRRAAAKLPPTLPPLCREAATAAAALSLLPLPLLRCPLPLLLLCCRGSAASALPPPLLGEGGVGSSSMSNFIFWGAQCECEVVSKKSPPTQNQTRNYVHWSCQRIICPMWRELGLPLNSQCLHHIQRLSYDD
jgi:hypothetical protein